MLNFALHDQVAVLAIDDGKANVISAAFCEAVHDALDRAEREAKAVVLSGRAGRFSAGFDLNEFKKGPEPTRVLLRQGAELMLRLFRHPQPLVAACTGHALAGGALLLLSMDTRVGAHGDFKIGLNETAIGMVLPQFGLILSRHRLSTRYLQAATIQARIYPPEAACEAGFLDEVVEPDLVGARALEVATSLATVAGDAYAGNKAKLRAEAIQQLEASMSELEGALT